MSNVVPAAVALPLRAGLFSEGGSPRLLGGRCGACQRYHFPRSVICPYCSAEGAEEVELSPVGRLWAWTAVTAAPPGYRGEVPYGFGVVELPEGLRVITRLTEADPGSMSEGQPMRLVLLPLQGAEDSPQVLSYAFSPEPHP